MIRGVGFFMQPIAGRFGPTPNQQIGRTAMSVRDYLGYGVITLAALSIGLACTPARSDEPAADTRAFQVRHELTVIAPKNAKNVWIWFTLPQDVPEQRT